MLNLIDQERRHNQMNKYFGQVLLTQPVVVTKIISLVLQGVEGLILYFSPGTDAAHEQVNVVLDYFRIQNLCPAE